MGLQFASMRTPRFAGPEWLVTIGGSFFILALAVSVIFVPEIGWLRLVQSSLYVAATTLSLQRGLSTAHFSQMFRKSMGESPHQFVLRHRVERAQELLRSSEARILDVAVACGFKTQQHFARTFRRMCGVSPSEYRLEWFARSDLALNASV